MTSSQRQVGISHAEKAVQANYRVYVKALRVLDQLAAVTPADAIVFAEALADFLWFNPAGIVSSPEIETLLHRIAVGSGQLSLSSAVTQASRKASRPDHILHIMSEAMSIGGHTRLVINWIKNDPQRCHSLVLTRQQQGIPALLSQAIQQSGGQLHILDAGPHLARARQLRGLIIQSELGVMHTHPNDAVPALAIAEPTGLPPLIYLNHADHVFWLGQKHVNVVADIRQTAVEYAVQARQIPQKSNHILPIPVEALPAAGRRQHAKAALGLPAQATVLFSFASNYKYAATPLEPDLADVCLPLLLANPQLYLVVLGITEPNRWQALKTQTNQRIITLPPTPEAREALQAADIYLDSFPFTSLTSLLEAALEGLPCATLDLADHAADILRFDDPALNDLVVRAVEPEEWRRRLQVLIDSPKLRAEVGRKTREKAVAGHSGKAWQAQLAKLYQAALVTPRLTGIPPHVVQMDYATILLQATHHQAGLTRSFDRHVFRDLRRYSQRAKIKLFLTYNLVAALAPLVLRRLYRIGDQIFKCWRIRSTL